MYRKFKKVKAEIESGIFVMIMRSQMAAVGTKEEEKKDLHCFKPTTSVLCAPRS